MDSKFETNAFTTFSRGVFHEQERKAFHMEAMECEVMGESQKSTECLEGVRASLNPMSAAMKSFIVYLQEVLLQR